MAINIKIGDQATQEDDSVKIKIKDPTLKERYNFKLELRRALNGDLLIFDHADIDIVVLKEKKKIVAFAKDIMSEIVYGAENRLFEYLRKKGIIAYDSIQGGNVYGSLEGALYQISEWITTERPYFESAQAHDDMMDDALLDPDADNSTELGEVPQEEEKGSIVQHNLFAPYLYGRYTY